MRSDHETLGLIHGDSELAGLLRAACEFDVFRCDHQGVVSVSSGARLEAVAGDFAGGTFFLCGEPGASRPVLYASSEGQAGLIGQSLAEALQVMIGLPSWWDCLKYSGGGDLAVMGEAARLLGRDEGRDRPERASRRDRLAELLGVRSAPVGMLLSLLRDAVAASEPDYVFRDETGEYESLFGPWAPSRNIRWASGLDR